MSERDKNTVGAIASRVEQIAYAIRAAPAHDFPDLAAALRSEAGKLDGAAMRATPASMSREPDGWVVMGADGEPELTYWGADAERCARLVGEPRPVYIGATPAEPSEALRVRHGRLLHDIMTAYPEHWDELEDYLREAWMEDAAQFVALLRQPAAPASEGEQRKHRARCMTNMGAKVCTCAPEEASER